VWEFAVEATGIDLARPLDGVTLDDLVHLIAEAGVVVLPDQVLTDEQQIAVSRQLGTLETYPASSYLQPSSHPEIAVISNVDPATDELLPPLDRRSAYNDSNVLWHSDSSFRAVPAAISILSAREIPLAGGNTEFADMRPPWDELSKDEKVRLQHRTALHSLLYSRRRLGGFEFTEAEKAKTKTVRQPLVRVHPVTGRKALYLGAHIGPIDGFSESESDTLVAELQGRGTRDVEIYSHRWRTNDVVIWDNRSVLHRASPYLQGTHRRVLHRTVVAEPGPLVEQF
jgi:alpha-ketoglutarate-dependent 2,4-dichlorophenoxyacetate dioxygenase